MRSFLLSRGEVIVIGDGIIVRTLEIGDEEVQLEIERSEGDSGEQVEAQELVCQGTGEPEPAI